MKKTGMVAGVAVALLITISIAFAARPTGESIDTIEKNLTERRAVLVDVREDRETNKGYIDGAILVPLSLLDEGKGSPQFGKVLAQRLPKKAIIYTYCAAGKRCSAAADILAKFGYDARPLKHSFQDLAKEGFVTAKPKFVTSKPEK